MKRITFLALFLSVLTTWSFAQKPLSPKAEATGKIGTATIKIVYSQPSAKGRKVVGGLVPFGEVWRTGANAATTFEIDKPVKIEGKDLAAGKYALFTLPGETEWSIIFSKDADQMGAFDYKKEDDALRVTVKPGKTSSFVETFNIAVEKDAVTLKWENTSVSFKVKG